MADEPENLVLRYLRSIDTKVDALRETMAEMTARTGRLETAVAQVRRDIADSHVILAEHSNRFDRIDTRLDRIETRVGLIEA
jgi:tetrahydromethanopterin S-methyltransferase subunit G